MTLIRSLLTTRIGLAVSALAIIILFVTFNESRRPLESVNQTRFDKWYEINSKNLGSGTINKISINLKLPSNLNHDWSVALPDPSAPNGSTDATNRMARILQLVSASKLFRYDERLNSPELATLSVDAKEEHFAASFPPSAIDGNIQLQNLVKLFQIFSITPAKLETPVNPTEL